MEEVVAPLGHPIGTPHVPAHAHLWLTAEQQEDWIVLKKQVPFLVMVCFVAFNVLSALSVRIINRKGAVKARSNVALLQYGVTAATHALISLAASSYAVVHRRLERESECGSRLFCFDDVSARLLTMHAGYALYEFLFWQNNAQLTRAWTEMLLLHNVVVVLQSLASLMYPSRLSILLLPVQQMLAVATLVDCARRFSAIYGAPWHLRFKLQLGFVAAHAVKALGGLGLAGFTWWWIRENNLWKLDLPEGMGALNSVYGMLMLGGGLMHAIIYMKWLGASLEMTNDLISNMRSSQDKSAAPAKAAAKTLTAGGRSRKKERPRR